MSRSWGGVLWGTGIGQFFFSIRKQHTVNKGTRVQGNGSEYFRGVVFSYSFSIYCAAYHGIWCSEKCLVRQGNRCETHLLSLPTFKDRVRSSAP